MIANHSNHLFHFNSSFMILSHAIQIFWRMPLVDYLTSAHLYQFTILCNYLPTAIRATISSATSRPFIRRWSNFLVRIANSSLIIATTLDAISRPSMTRMRRYRNILIVLHLTVSVLRGTQRNSVLTAWYELYILDVLPTEIQLLSLRIFDRPHRKFAKTRSVTS